MLTFKEYLKENAKSRYSNNYRVGDIVYIRYWLTGDMTPVKLKEKIGNSFLVSHKVENSHYFNAPEHTVKKDDIVGMYQGITSAPFNTDNRLNNPTYNPDVSGSIPTWNTFNNSTKSTSIPSNDIAF